MSNEKMDDKLNKEEKIYKNMIYFFSLLYIAIYIISIIIILFCIKRIAFIKSKSLTLLLLNSITGFIQLYLNNNKYFVLEHLFLFISYIFHFHLIISSINKLLKGKYIFSSDINFTIKYLTHIEFIYIPLITFPYKEIFKLKVSSFCLYQNITIIISLIFLYSYIQKYIQRLINILDENLNFKIEIPFMESQDLMRVYQNIGQFWLICFILGEIYYSFSIYIHIGDKDKYYYLWIFLFRTIIKYYIILIFFGFIIYTQYKLNKSYSKKDYNSNYISFLKTNIRKNKNNIKNKKIMKKNKIYNDENDNLL